MSEVTAYIDCRCGQCRMTLGDPTMRYRIYCLCYDCRQRPLIAGSLRPEYPLPAAFVNDERGADLMYFTNALLVNENSCRLLAFSKLRAGSDMVTAWTTCCDTPMCSSHPFYAGTSILVGADSCRVITPFSVEPQFYDFLSDYPEEKVAALPPLPLPPVFNEGPEEMEGESMRTALEKLSAPMAPQYQVAPYTTFDQLRAGQPITIKNGCYEESRRRG